MVFVWKPEEEVFIFCGSEHPRYYCNKCKHVHYFDSKKGKEHVKFGEYPNFPFLPGKVIINIPRKIKLRS